MRDNRGEALTTDSRETGSKGWEATSSRKIDRRILRTKRNIRAALVELMEIKNLSEISVSELSKAADIDRKTFYAHYATVPDVYRDMLAEIAGELDRQLVETSPFDWSSFIRAITQIMENDLPFFRAIATHNSYGYLVDECRDVLVRHLQKMDAMTREGIPSENDEIRVRYVAAGIVSLYIDWLRGEVKVELDELMRTLSELCGQLIEPAGDYRLAQRTDGPMTSSRIALGRAR